MKIIKILAQLLYRPKSCKNNSPWSKWSGSQIDKRVRQCETRLLTSHCILLYMLYDVTYPTECYLHS